MGQMAYTGESGSSQLQQITYLANAFLDDKTTIPADVDTVIHYLEARPTAHKFHDHVPVDDMETRLQLAAQIRDKVWAQQDTHLTAFEVSVIMLAPLDTVQEWLGKSNSGALERGTTEALVRTCMWPLSHQWNLTNQD